MDHENKHNHCTSIYYDSVCACVAAQKVYLYAAHEVDLGDGGFLTYRCTCQIIPPAKEYIF